MWGYFPFSDDPPTEPRIPVAPPPPLPRLILCKKCGCTYVGRCPQHDPQEGKYEP